MSDSLCQHYAEDDAADDGDDVVGFALWVMQRVVCIDCALCDWVHGYLLIYESILRDMYWRTLLRLDAPKFFYALIQTLPCARHTIH